MTSAISGVFGVPSGVGGLTGVAGIAPAPGVQETQGPTAAPGADGFAAVLAASFDQLQGAQKTADTFATQAATGDLRDVHDYMIASQEASLATEMVVTVKNKAVEAFNEIMRMPV